MPLRQPRIQYSHHCNPWLLSSLPDPVAALMDEVYISVNWATIIWNPGKPWLCPGNIQVITCIWQTLVSMVFVDHQTTMTTLNILWWNWTIQIVLNRASITDSFCSLAWGPWCCLLLRKDFCYQLFFAKELCIFQKQVPWWWVYGIALTSHPV